jgi:hypothetical protein
MDAIKFKYLKLLAPFGSGSTIFYVGPFSINTKLDMGNILTALSIFGSAIFFMYSFRKDRELRKGERANRIRNAAAVTIAKLDRWREISLSLFEEIQPLFVTTTERMAKDYNAIESRDYLWKNLSIINNKVYDIIRKENIETVPIDLYGYNQEVRDLFNSSLGNLKKEQKSMFEDLSKKTQNAVLYFTPDKKEEYSNAKLGNALRLSAGGIRSDYEKKLGSIIQPVENFLNAIINESDKDLLDKKL